MIMELIIDSFAGGGGASTGIEAALGRSVDIAINHDEEALAMHKANHPNTHHMPEDIWKIDPLEATKGRPVGLLWASPDCTHFSKARGSKPVKKKIRGLANVVVKWAKQVRPRVIILENVAEFQGWGPVGKDNMPIKARKGEFFKRWVRQIRKLGYQVEWKSLVAADYGAPTIRKRLFLIARCDGQKIVWPGPTHGPGRSKPYRTAAECIDWSLPCPSIFTRKRPLVENTMRRIAMGLKKYVFEMEEPFIVTCNHGGDGFRGQGLTEPMKTITSARDAHGLVTPYLARMGHTKSTGRCKYVSDVTDPLTTIVSKAEHLLVAPHLTKYHGPKSKNEFRGSCLDDPIRTLDTSNRYGLVTAFLAKHFGGAIGTKVSNPLPTITARGTQTQIVTPFFAKLYGTCKHGQSVEKPMPTVTATGQHIAEVRAFLIKYYGTATGQDVRSPLHTVTNRMRLGLVTVAGVNYQIIDIGMRMLQPRELALAQGFPYDYILTGTKTRQVAKIGNSVCPAMAEVLVRANVKLREIEAVESA